MWSDLSRTSWIKEHKEKKEEEKGFEESGHREEGENLRIKEEER